MLDELPVELLYEIQLYAASEWLPLVSTRLHKVFKSAPATFNADYLLNKINQEHSAEKHLPTRILTYALRYPISSIHIVETLCRLPPLSSTTSTLRPELPRRLFRGLQPPKGTRRWKDRDHPIPYLRHLYSFANIVPDINAFEGYALVRATFSEFIPLVEFLLEHGASPQLKDGLAVRVAIKTKNLSLVKLLVEPASQKSPSKGGTGSQKRRKMEDRVKVNQSMAYTAAKVGAKDILQYLIREKGCVPDMQTLHLL